MIFAQRILTDTITAKSRPQGIELITLMMTHLAIAPQPSVDSCWQENIFFLIIFRRRTTVTTSLFFTHFRRLDDFNISKP